MTTAPDEAATTSSGGPHLRLGDWLRSERLRRGITFAEVERDTRVNRLYLEALEDEHYEVIPAPVYVRGFVRSYARHLGLDPEQCIALLPADLPRPPGLEPSPMMRRARSEPSAVSMPSMPSLRLPNLPAGIGRALPDPQWLLAGLAAVALVLAAVYVPGLLERRAPASEAQTPVTVSTPASTGAGKMPNLIGAQQDAATRALQDAGATWILIEVANTSSPAGTVIGQSPVPGDPLKQGDNVTLTVAKAR